MPTHRPTTDNKLPAREPVKEKQVMLLHVWTGGLIILLQAQATKGENAQEIKKLQEQLQQYKKQQQVFRMAFSGVMYTVMSLLE